MGITSIRLADDVEQPLEFLAKQSSENVRWQNTLDALESIKAGTSLDEADVNSWLNSWGTGKRTPQPK